MATQIARVDGAVTVEIPEELLKKANLSVGDPVEWTLTSTGALALHAPRDADAGSPEDGYGQWKTQEMDAGEDVPNKKVIEWLRSWGTEHELPPPQCN